MATRAERRAGADARKVNFDEESANNVVMSRDQRHEAYRGRGASSGAVLAGDNYGIAGIPASLTREERHEAYRGRGASSGAVLRGDFPDEEDEYTRRYDGPMTREEREAARSGRGASSGYDLMGDDSTFAKANMRVHGHGGGAGGIPWFESNENDIAASAARYGRRMPDADAAGGPLMQDEHWSVTLSTEPQRASSGQIRVRSYGS